MSVKVKYSVTQALTFRGTAEVSEAEYEAMQEAEAAGDDDILGSLILDHVDQTDPQDWDVESVDQCDKVA